MSFNSQFLLYNIMHVCSSGDEHHQIQLQSLKQGRIEFLCVCTDTLANDQPREIALYSEVVPSNKQKKHASSRDVKADNAYSEHKSTGAPTKCQGLAGGQGNTGELSQEALYDQPVSLIACYWDSK